MRFLLLVYQYSPYEVAELTDMFLAEDGIGLAADHVYSPAVHTHTLPSVRIRKHDHRKR